MTQTTCIAALKPATDREYEPEEDPVVGANNYLKKTPHFQRLGSIASITPFLATMPEGIINMLVPKQCTKRSSVKPDPTKATTMTFRVLFASLSLSMGASNLGIIVVLEQIAESQLQPLGFISQKLSRSEAT
ncbi:hypothetical protein SK128_021627 [Halocaridina rubra]|uniref:Uncharacterized protein n=1 Tax=Halocaridina rubra TaxID=373956 RepID=A0AAN8WWV9_HALRR